LPEYPATIPTLWNAVKGPFICPSRLATSTENASEFINANPDLVSTENAMAFLSDDGGETYNRCHCKLPVVPTSGLALTGIQVWSNFEIGKFSVWPTDTTGLK
jgi:alpha 1,2-mannosyltransferase